MFVINLEYTAPIIEIDACLAEHREWLDTQYQAGKLLCSGPKNPRDGGIIIALGNDKQQVINMLEHDPFNVHKVAKYTITEFTPVKNHHAIAGLITQ